MSIASKAALLPSKFEPRREKTGFLHAKTKTQISFAVTAKLISAFVSATQIVQSPYFLNPKFLDSSNLQWLYSPLYVGHGRKPRRPVFSQRGSFEGLKNPTTTRTCLNLKGDYSKVSDVRVSKPFGCLFRHCICSENKSCALRNMKLHISNDTKFFIMNINNYIQLYWQHQE